MIEQDVDSLKDVIMSHDEVLRDLRTRLIVIENRLTDDDKYRNQYNKLRAEVRILKKRVEIFSKAYDVPVSKTDVEQLTELAKTPGHAMTLMSRVVLLILGRRS